MNFSSQISFRNNKCHWLRRKSLGSETGKLDRYFYLSLTGIMLFGFYLRVRDLGRESFWLDEFYSVMAARFPFEQILDQVAVNKPPLDYFILHFFLKLGETEFWARLPACLFETAAIGGVAILAANFCKDMPFRKFIALAAALLVATAALRIRYSQEARPYGLFFCSLVFAQAFFVQLLAGDFKNRKALAGYYFCSIISMLTLYFASIFLVFNILFLTFLSCVRFLRKAACRDLVLLLLHTVGIIMLACVMLWPMRGNMVEAVQENFFLFKSESITYDDFMRMLNALGIGYTRSAYVFLINGVSNAVLFIPFAIIGTCVLARRNAMLAVYAVTCFFVSIFAVVACMKIMDKFLAVRYMMQALPPYYALLGLGTVAAAKWIYEKLSNHEKHGFVLLAPAIILSIVSVIAISLNPSQRANYRDLYPFLQKIPVDDLAVTHLYRFQGVYSQYYVEKTGADFPVIAMEYDAKQIPKIASEHPNVIFLADYMVMNHYDRWLSEFPQLSFSNFHLFGWYSWPPEKHFENPIVRQRAKTAFNQNSRLVFGSENFDFLGRGWSGFGSSKSGDRWAIKMDAEVLVWIEELRDYQVSMRCDPFSYSGAPQQRVSVFINKPMVARFNFEPGFHEYSFFIKKSELTSGLNRLRFQFSYVKAPGELSKNSQDARELAARFQWIQFDKLAADAEPAENPGVVNGSDKLMPDDAMLGFPEGWGPVESDAGKPFRWSMGRRSKLTFFLRDPAQYSITLSGQPLVYENWGGQNMTVALNGKPVSGFDLKPGSGEYSLSVGKTFLQSGRNTLLLEFSNVVSVKDVIKDSADDRQLAFRLEQLSFEKQE